MRPNLNVAKQSKLCLCMRECCVLVLHYMNLVDVVFEKLVFICLNVRHLC